MPSNLNQATVCGTGQTMGINPCITMSQTALKIMKALPQASDTGLVNNVPNSEHDFTNGDQGDVKIDWNPNDSDHVSVRYSEQHVVQQFVNSQASAVQHQWQRKPPALERRH